MAGDYTVVTADYVNVQISNSLTSFASEKRFPKSITIAELKVDLSCTLQLLQCVGPGYTLTWLGRLCAKNKFSWLGFFSPSGNGLCQTTLIFGQF